MVQYLMDAGVDMIEYVFRVWEVRLQEEPSCHVFHQESLLNTILNF
jgi:hypothetical protein